MISISNVKDFKDMKPLQECLDVFMRYLNSLIKDILENKDAYKDLFDELDGKKLSAKNFDFSSVDVNFEYHETFEEGKKRYEELGEAEEAIESDNYIIRIYPSETIMYPKA